MNLAMLHKQGMVQINVEMGVIMLVLDHVIVGQLLDGIKDVLYAKEIGVILQELIVEIYQKIYVTHKL